MDSNFSINYETKGDGPPVILIHGMGASLRQWDFLMPKLASAGFTAYALDLQGHGDSPKPSKPENYHIEVLYDQLDQWIKNLELEDRAILVGHSLGGYLSLMYGLRNPEKLHAFVLADPFYSPLQLSPFIRYIAKHPNFVIRALDLLPAWTLDMVMFGTERVQQALPSRVRRQLARDFKRATPLFLYVTRTVRDLTPQLSRIQQPTLVMWGSQDLTLSPGSFSNIIRELSNADSYVFLGCGHIPHLTQSTIFNQRVLDFMASLPD